MNEPQPASDQKVTGRKRQIVIALDKGILWFTRRWVVVLSALIGLYVGIPFLAPVALNAGLPGPATVIYRLYSPVCHQFAFRSWFLYGDQVTYPRELAGVDRGTFEQYASAEPYFDGIDLDVLDADLIYAAKQFVGSERMGYKVAFCQRDVAIYLAIALFGILFLLLRKLKIRVPYLPFWAYILIALVPIGLDGVSQYFANPPFTSFGFMSFFPVRESTPFLRVLTGALFGIGNAWLAYPYIQDSMEETRELVEEKLVKAGVIASSEAPAAD